jgi:two-component system, OmpR family, alkaline phosphatase synthesis response regulator PhoP
MSYTILVVDNDADFCEATFTLLVAKGYTVLSASNGDDGYYKAKSTNPSLILLDVMMAHNSEGFDVARKLKEDPSTKDIPIVMITGIRKTLALPFGFEPDQKWLPVKTVLEKPVKPEKLLSAIKDALDIKT